jgi:hypothetical protein
MISWSVTASFLRILGSLQIRIPLNGIADGYKIIKTEIINDVLIVSLKNIKSHS